MYLFSYILVVFRFGTECLPHMTEELHVVISKLTFPCYMHFGLELTGKEMGRKLAHYTVTTPYFCHIFHWIILFSWQIQTVLDIWKMWSLSFGLYLFEKARVSSDRVLWILVWQWIDIAFTSPLQCAVGGTYTMFCCIAGQNSTYNFLWVSVVARKTGLLIFAV